MSVPLLSIFTGQRKRAENVLDVPIPRDVTHPVLVTAMMRKNKIIKAVARQPFCLPFGDFKSEYRIVFVPHGKVCVPYVVV